MMWPVLCPGSLYVGLLHSLTCPVVSASWWDLFHCVNCTVGWTTYIIFKMICSSVWHSVSCLVACSTWLTCNIVYCVPWCDLSCGVTCFMVWPVFEMICSTVSPASLCDTLCPVLSCSRAQPVLWCHLLHGVTCPVGWPVLCVWPVHGVTCFMV